MPGLITKRGKKRWRASITDKGITYQKLFRDATSKSKRAAYQWEEAILKNIKSNPTPTACLSIHDWANEYLNYAQQNFVEKTYKEKTAVFRELITHFGDVPVTRITTPKAFQFLQKEFNARSGHAANKDRKNLAAAWKYGRKYIDGFPETDINPFSEATKFREERKPRYIPPEDDFWKVYNVSGGQDTVMLSAFLYLAARRKEVFGLKWSDVDFENKQVRLWTQKREGGTREADWLPMIPELSDALKKWKDECPIKDSPFVFICLDTCAFAEPYYGKPFKVRQHFMKKLCKKAGVTHFGYHAIRHLTASMLYHKGVQVSVIQALLRHKSPTTTNTYLKSLGVEFVRSSLEEMFEGAALNKAP